MSAAPAEVAAVTAVRDEYTDTLARRGHAIRWQLGPNARRRGHAYFWEGRCERCGAELSIGDGWSSCPGVRDARHTTCSGPGTAVLTDIETAHVHEQISDAMQDFLWERG